LQAPDQVPTRKQITFLKANYDPPSQYPVASVVIPDELNAASSVFISFSLADQCVLFEGSLRALELTHF